MQKTVRLSLAGTNEFQNSLKELEAKDESPASWLEEFEAAAYRRAFGTKAPSASPVSFVPDTFLARLIKNA